MLSNNDAILNLLYKYCLIIILFSVSSLYAQNLESQKLKLAQSFEQDGNIDNAANLYLELYQSNPAEKGYFEGYVRTLLIKEEYSKLLTFVRNHSVKYPSGSVSILLGELYWRTGDVPNADKIWGEVLSSSTNYMIFQELSVHQSRLRLFDKAISTLLTGRSRIKNDDLYSDELSQLYSITGEYKKGTEEIIKLYTSTNNQQVAEGRISALLNYPEAQSFIYDRLKSNADKNPKITRLFAWFLRTIKQYNEALELYKKLDDINSANGGEVFDFSLSCMNDGYYDIAIEGYNWILAKGNESHFSVAALYNLARALELKQLSTKELTIETADEIIGNYRKVIKDYPNTPTADDCKYNIAGIYFRIGKNDLALNETEQLLKKFYNAATAAKANLLIADIYFMKNDIDKAVIEYNKISKLYRKYNNEYFKAKYSIAEIEYFRGELDSAIAHFTDLTAQTNSDVANDALEKISLIEQNRNFNKGFSIYANAEMQSKQNHFDKALNLYLEASEVLPPGDLSDNCLLNAAEIEVKNKNFENAKKQLESINKMNPSTIYQDLIDFRIAQILILENKLTAAVETLTQLIKKYPKSIYCEKSRELIVKIRNKIN